MLVLAVNPSSKKFLWKTGRDEAHQERWEAAAEPGEDRIVDAAKMQNGKLFLSEDSATERPRWRLWRSRALIFALITASTAALLICPCDNTDRNPHAISLIALSVLIGASAALLIYRELRRRSDITAFLKAVIASAIVLCGVYAEFAVAMDLIAWLARRGR
jgi:hypothetical protein